MCYNRYMRLFYSGAESRYHYRGKEMYVEEGKSIMRVETITLNETRNVTLTAYIQETGGEFRYVTKRPAVLVLPGGGYEYCSEREADPVALPYLKAGYQAFILRYSVKADAVWPNPLSDYEQAMEMIRGKAEEWKLYPDKIAVIGFSAGGHLAAAAATMAKNRPNAAILGYAVAGNDVKCCNQSAPDTIPEVDKDTCPCFLFATRTDNVVPIMNSIGFMEALAKADISFESHIYSYGPHGFSTGDPSIQTKDTQMSERVPHWVEDSIGWLKEVFGEFGPDGLTEPAYKAHVTDDCEAFLSVDCTMARIMGNPEGARIVGEVFAEIQRKTGADRMGDAMQDFLRKMKLRDVLGFGEAPEEYVCALNEQLSKVPNI